MGKRWFLLSCNLFHAFFRVLCIILLRLQPAVVDENAQEQHGECSGYLCIKAAWPGMMRTLQGDHDRYETTYFAPFKGFYFSGDGCRRSASSLLWSSYCFLLDEFILYLRGLKLSQSMISALMSTEN